MVDGYGVATPLPGDGGTTIGVEFVKVAAPAAGASVPQATTRHDARNPVLNPTLRP
jgi:hypothetical protein